MTHYYAKGDQCDETGKQRDVQLRFRYACIASSCSMYVCVVITLNNASKVHPFTVIFVIQQHSTLSFYFQISSFTFNQPNNVIHKVQLNLTKMT